MLNARSNNTVGENYRAMANIKPGRTGKRLAKKDRREIAEKLMEAARQNPSLIKAALNAMKECLG